MSPTTWAASRKLLITAASYRVPFLIYAPQIVQPARISGICSQLDVAPTIHAPSRRLIRTLLLRLQRSGREPDSGFAWILNGQQLIFINGLRQGVVISPGDHHTFFTFNPPDKINQLDSTFSDIRLSQMPISILQTATLVFESGTYNLNSSGSPAENTLHYSRRLSNTR